MKKETFLTIRVKPSLKLALKRVIANRSNPGIHEVTMTDIVMDALYANDPEVFAEMKKIEATEAANWNKAAQDTTS